MKTIFFSTFFIVFLFGPTGSCETEPPFEYENNSRVILQGKLVDQNNQILPNQRISVYAGSSGTIIELSSWFSDANGNFFISTPNGNNPIYIKFTQKKILSSQFYTELVKKPSFEDHWIGFLQNKQYNFGTIILTEN